jgi:hypothetical protein
LHQALRRRPQASAMLLSRTMKAVAKAIRLPQSQAPRRRPQASAMLLSRTMKAVAKAIRPPQSQAPRAWSRK